MRHEDADILVKATYHIDQDRIVKVDLSHAHWIITIKGHTAPEVLMQLMPIDFDLDDFPSFTFVQTGIDGIPVLIHRHGDEAFEVITPYTWASSIAGLAMEASQSLVNG